MPRKSGSINLTLSGYGSTQRTATDASKGMPVHGIAVGFFLWVNADVLHVGAHTVIVAG
jgi:hypothetical protein